MNVLPFRRPEPIALPLHRALAAWEADNGEATTEELAAFATGYRLEPQPPLVRAFLAGQLARVLADLDDGSDL